ncbi:DUF6890 family protein [Marinomonas atlantica]
MKHLPHAQDDAESWGRALWLEERQLELHTAAVTNGISKAFAGR